MTKPYRRKRKYKQSTLEAKLEAQKLAFAPISFQATKALRDLGILEELCADTDLGMTPKSIAKNLSLSDYAVETLLEVGCGLNLVDKKDDGRVFITKIGLFILNDEMTKVNMDFVNDVCYQGSFFMQESLQNSKPEGLKVFGDWETIYQGLQYLPKKAKESWFNFDHFYSDAAFDEALKIVFGKNKPKKLFDIGANTGKWTVKCLNHNKDVIVTLLDLPGQLRVAEDNLATLSLLDRVNLYEIDVLNQNSKIPEGADAVWVSQFLDCFSKEQIIAILSKVAKSMDGDCDIYILEPLWDQQKYEAASLSLNLTSLYFTCMANGNSKMYSFNEYIECANEAGLYLVEAFHDVGENDYSLLRLRKR